MSKLESYMVSFLVFLVIPISIVFLFIEVDNNYEGQKLYKCQPVKVKKFYEGNSEYSEKTTIFYCKDGTKITKEN